VTADVLAEDALRAATVGDDVVDYITTLQEPVYCAHTWPAELEPETPCGGCGLPYGEWSEDTDV
jgi:hypothetical protein